MENFTSLMHDIWREACRHIEIEVSSRSIGRIIARRLPIEELRVVSLDPSRSSASVRTVPTVEDGPVTHREHGIQGDTMTPLLSWISSAIPDTRGRYSPLPVGPYHSIVPAPGPGTVLVPLRSEHGTSGILALHTTKGEFTPEHLKMAALLREPFSTAIENDRRFHELRILREKAEAEKDSALRRLGRESMRTVVIGENGGLRNVMERISRVIRSPVPVLLLGETGSGKEVIARYIHDHSDRGDKPFIRVNCGAIPPELIDSELFGHEKGSFTGAAGLRRGWFERADEGTLLLDEIGDLPLPAQVRLLRVLQEGEFERVGGETPVHVDLRVIAATHRDLPRMVQNGKFREDLWYRISGYPVVIPPLRERRQDIPELAGHLAEKASRRFGLRPVMPTDHDLEELLRYDWPGNVREIASVIDRAALLGDGEYLDITAALGTGTRSPGPDTGQDSGKDRKDHNPASTVSTRAEAPGGPLQSLDSVMEHHIRQVLEVTRGVIEGPNGAARILGLNPHTLRGRMRKLGVRWQQYRRFPDHGPDPDQVTR